MELTYDELSRIISEICSGQKLVFVENMGGEEVPIVLRHPTYIDKETSHLVYMQALKEAENMGIPSSKDMEGMSKKRKFFSDEKAAKLEKLEKQIKGQKVLLQKTTRVPARRNRIKEVIDALEKEAAELRFLKDRHLENTRERKAAEEKLLYLCSKNVLNPLSNSLFWENKEKFDNETDYVLRRNIFTEYVIFHHGVPTPTLRYIARSNLWRIRYVTAVKTSETLFGHSIRDYTVDQMMLMYWSNYYQSIYEMLPDDRPMDSIIEDDASLDAYMESWSAERNRESASSRATKNNKHGRPSAWDQGEVLVFKSNEMYEDIEYSDTLATKQKAGGSSSFDSAAFGRSKDKKNR